MIGDACISEGTEATCLKEAFTLSLRTTSSSCRVSGYEGKIRPLAKEEEICIKDNGTRNGLCWCSSLNHDNCDLPASELLCETQFLPDFSRLCSFSFIDKSFLKTIGAGLPSLTVLSLDDSGLDDGDFMNLLNTLPPSLEILSLSGNLLSDEGFLSARDTQSAFAALKSLNVSLNEDITTLGVCALVQGSTFPRLEMLDVSHNNLSDNEDEIDELLLQVMLNLHLTHINFSGCEEVPPDTCKTVFTLLKQNSCWITKVLSCFCLAAQNPRIGGKSPLYLLPNDLIREIGRRFDSTQGL